MAQTFPVCTEIVATVSQPAQNENGVTQPGDCALASVEHIEAVATNAIEIVRLALAHV